MLDVIKWCMLCNSGPANGRLTVIFDGETEPEVVDACAKCVRNIPPESWIGEQ